MVTTTTVNGLGCWDWWGYDDPNYAKKSGRQLLMTKRMVDRVTSGYAPVAAPQNLAVKSTPNGSLRLTWNAVSGAIGYYVYRDGSAVNGTRIIDSHYTDSGLERNTSYTYTVRAVAANGNLGPASAPVVVTAR
jgi:hypothetical protein